MFVLLIGVDVLLLAFGSDVGCWNYYRSYLNPPWNYRFGIADSSLTAACLYWNSDFSFYGGKTVFTRFSLGLAGNYGGFSSLGSVFASPFYQKILRLKARNAGIRNLSDSGDFWRSFRRIDRTFCVSFTRRMVAFKELEKEFKTCTLKLYRNRHERIDQNRDLFGSCVVFDCKSD